jgi:hypothetical protein
MKYPSPSQCPVCGHGLHITALECSHCKTRIEGEFVPHSLAELDENQGKFVISFLQCRGNIREMEKVLGVSYPTVRGRLEEIIRVLDPTDSGQSYDKATGDISQRQKTLQALARGEIDLEAAMSEIQDSPEFKKKRSDRDGSQRHS